MTLTKKFVSAIAAIAIASTAALAQLSVTPVYAVNKAGDFLNTLGVGTKDIQLQDTPAQIINGINYLGVRHIRDDATHNVTGAGSRADLCAIHAATKVIVHELPIVDADPNNIADTKAQWDQLAACGAIGFVEGPNEPNNFNFTYQGALCSMGGSFLPCAKYQRDLYAMVKADPALAHSVPRVYGLTEPGAEPDDVGLQFLTIPAGSGLVMPDGTKYADGANTHNYVQGNGAAGTTLIDNHARYAETVNRSGPDAGDWDLYGEYWGFTWNRGFPGGPDNQTVIPKITTETGWNIYKGSITYEMQGKLINDVLLDAFQLGWSKTIVYEMFEHNPSPAPLLSPSLPFFTIAANLHEKD